MSNRDQRRNVRVPFQSVVDLVFHDRVYPHCITRDLSIKGLYVTGIEGPGRGEECEIILHLEGSSDQRLWMKGEVVRVEPNGVALHFNEIDMESFFLLRDIMRFNVDDPETVDKECAGTASRNQSGE
jgi:hypothetical protein